MSTASGPMGEEDRVPEGGGTTGPLAPAKVRCPALPKDAVSRPRLTKLLHAGLEQRLVIVTAPAGYGKTTLLAQFAQEVDFPVCWMTVDRWDSEPISFVESLVWALRRSFPEFGRNTLFKLKTVSNFARETQAIAAIFIKDMEALDDYFALVLDDCHHLDNSEALLEFLEMVVSYLPEHAHLVMSSRSRPKLRSLPRLLANREATQLTTEDMRFTDEEAASLLCTLSGASLTEDEMREVVRQCAGWPAALVLTTMGKGRSQAAPWDTRQLFEYLAAEVLAQQRPALRDFLLRTSVLPSLRPDLCDALLGVERSQETLNELAEISLVTRVAPGEQPEYRYHGLVQEVLRRRLAGRGAAHYVDVLVHAGRVLADAGLWQGALDSYCEARRWNLATVLLERNADQLAQAGRWTVLAQALDKLPLEVLQERRGLLVWRARACIEEGRPEEALRLLSSVIASREAGQDREVLARACTTAGIALRLTGKLDASLSQLERARAISSELEGRPALRSEVLHNLGIAHAIKRDLHRARPLLQEALELSELAGDAARACKVRYDLGVMSMDQGLLEEALVHYDLALRGLAKLGNEVEATFVLNNLGMAYFWMAEYELALDVLIRAASKSSGLELTRTQAYCQLTLADVYRTLGRYEEAFEAYSLGIHLAGRCDEAQLLVAGQDGLAQAYLRSGQVGQAKVLLKEALALAKAQRLDWQEGVLLVTLSQVHAAEGALAQGEEGLRRAVELLESAQSPMELCRARLHLANMHLAQNKTDQAVAQLETLSAHLQERQSHYFLVPDLLHMPELLSLAVQRRTGNGLFLMLSRKVEAVHRLIEKGREIPCPTSQPVLQTCPAIDAFAFGRGRVLLNGREVTSLEWRSAKAKELFFFLACASRPITKEEILAGLWPDEPGEKASNSFKSNMFRARRALYFDCLAHDDGYYRLSPKGPFRFDASDFLTLLERARRLPRGSNLRAECLSQALSLYAGPFLTEFYSEWCESKRRELESQYVGVLATLAGYYAGKGDFERAADLCEQVLRIDPLNEDALTGAMAYYAEAGNRQMSLRVYRRAQQTHREELGCALPESAERLYRRITEGKLATGDPESR